MIQPGVYSYSYISYFPSRFHVWFIELGYPELDILEYKDGSWDIIQYYSPPHVPAETKWQVVLGNMKNIEISYAFCQKYAKQLDLQQKEFWDREDAVTQEVEDEDAALQKHKAESVEIATKAIVNNPELMDRIAKNGLKEMDLGYIAKNIPSSEYTKPKVKGVTKNVIRDSSEPPN